MLGIGATTSIASAEEIKNAIANQKEVEDIREKLIDTIKISALTKAVEEYKISDDKVVEVLKKYGYYATNQILVKDYKVICDELGKLKEVK
jgi:3-oxoacyl-[acyl-carrier-protein] synthase III